MTTYTLAEFHAALKAQGVPASVHLTFICPMCGTLQSMQDLIDAGAGDSEDDVEKYIGFSCVGRFTHALPPPVKKGTQIGCNWTLGGLFSLHTTTIIMPDGTEHARFDLATPEQAQAHHQRRTTTPKTDNAG